MVWQDGSFKKIRHGSRRKTFLQIEDQIRIRRRKRVFVKKVCEHISIIRRDNPVEYIGMGVDISVEGRSLNDGGDK